MTGKSCQFLGLGAIPNPLGMGCPPTARAKRRAGDKPDGLLRGGSLAKAPRHNLAGFEAIPERVFLNIDQNQGGCTPDSAK